MANEKRLIDANALFKAIKNDKVAWRFGVPNTLKLLFAYLRIFINEQPTVDAVEVVRCKDCRLIIDREDGTHGCYRHFMEECKPDDFCSYGERREGE